MRILDTAKKRQKQEAKEDLRKAIQHTLDNVDVEEAWEALGESLQNAMGALGLGDPFDVEEDEEFSMMIGCTALALGVMEKL